jgi:hypothetical protein
MTRRKYRRSTRLSAALFTSLLTIAWMFVAALPVWHRSSPCPAPAEDERGGTGLHGDRHRRRTWRSRAVVSSRRGFGHHRRRGAAFTFTNNAVVTNTIPRVDGNEAACAEGEATDGIKWVVPVLTTIDLSRQAMKSVDSTHALTATVGDQLGSRSRCDDPLRRRPRNPSLMQGLLHRRNRSGRVQLLERRSGDEHDHRVHRRERE